MKRFRFRLDRLLRIKQQKERLAELKQLQARGVFDAADREAKELIDRLSSSAATIESRVGQPVEAIVWHAQYQHMTQLRQGVDNAEAKAERAKAALDEANRHRKAAAAEVDALQFVRRGEFEKHRDETVRANQARIDEMYLSRWRPDRGGLARTDTDVEVNVP